MKRPTFREYVRSHTPEDSPAGDFLMDAKHPQAKMPEVTSWRELEVWLSGVGGHAQLPGAKQLWLRYAAALKSELVVGAGYTVGQLIDMLSKEDPAALVVMFQPKSKPQFVRVGSFSHMPLQRGDKLVPTVVLESGDLG